MSPIVQSDFFVWQSDNRILLLRRLSRCAADFVSGPSLVKAEAEIDMDAKILKVVKCGEIVSVPSEKAQDGKLNKRTLVLQELGGKYENQYVVSTFGALAAQRCEEGCLVAATLRFQTHEHNGAEFQDVVANDIVAI